MYNLSMLTKKQQERILSALPEQKLPVLCLGECSLGLQNYPYYYMLKQ